MVKQNLKVKHKTMRRFFGSVWRVIKFPFELLFKIITFPFRKLWDFRKFLNHEPTETHVLDALANLVSESGAREEFVTHLEEFRMHLLRSVIALSLLVITSFWYAEPAMAFLAKPVGGLDQLQAIQVTEEIGVFMRVAMTMGIAVAFPYIAFEFWLFAATGLKPREKKMALAGIPLAAFLFLTGMAFTYFVMLPAALPFLGSFTTIAQFWSAQEYFSFVTGLMLWIGFFFEFPLVIFVLSSIGLVEPKFLADQWRLAVVIIAVLAAAITPTVDPVNMGLVMAPMILLYFISIGLSYIAAAGRRKNAETKEASESLNDDRLG